MQLRVRLADYLSQQQFRVTPDSTVLLDDRAASQKAEAACAVHFLGDANDVALQAVEDSIESCTGPTVIFQPFGATLTAIEELFLKDLAPGRYPHRPGSRETELKKFLEELLAAGESSAVPASLALVCEPAAFPWVERLRAEGISVDYPRFLLEKLWRHASSLGLSIGADTWDFEF